MVVWRAGLKVPVVVDLTTETFDVGLVENLENARLDAWLVTWFTTRKSTCCNEFTIPGNVEIAIFRVKASVHKKYSSDNTVA